MSIETLILWIISVIVAYLGAHYANSTNRRIKKVLSWVPTPPRLPLIGHSLMFPDARAVLRVFSEFTKQYGRMFKVQIGFDHLLIISDYRYVEHVLSSTTMLTKSVNYRFLHNWLGTGLATSSGPKWKQRRRILQPAFHFSILGEYITVFDEKSRQLVTKLENTLKEDHIDVHPYINVCALDVICEAMMGVPVNAQVSENSNYVRSVKTMIKILMERTFSAIQNIDSLYGFTDNYREEKEALKVLHEKTLSVIEERRKYLETSKTTDANEDEFGVRRKFAFLDALLQATVDGRPLSNEDIREEVDTFMFAGHDSVTSGICFALYALSQAPCSIQDAIIEEQKTIYGKERDRSSTMVDLQKMEYLDLVLKEVWRLYPTVPLLGRLTEEDYEFESSNITLTATFPNSIITFLAGKVIPKGVNIIINIYETHRDPRVFSDPEKFDPSRWENMEGRSPYSFIPFSAGPRNCIGQKFGILELKCTISKILRHFELLPAPPEYKPILQAQVSLTSGNGIHVKLKKRQWI